MARQFRNNAYMVAVARQSDVANVTTPPSFPGDFHIFSAEVDLPAVTTAAATWKAGKSQLGAVQAPIPGRRSATFKMKFPLFALRTGYAAASTGPGTAGSLSPMALILANALGSGGGSPTASNFLAGTHLAIANYIAGGGTGVSAATSTTVTVPSPGADSYALPGEFAAFAADDNDTTPQVGWVKSHAGGLITLYEASGNTANAGDALLGTGTAYLSPSQHIPLNIRILSPVANGSEMGVGCYCIGGELDLKQGEEPWVTLDFIAMDWQRISGAAAIAAATGAWYVCPPAASVSNGRLTYGPSGTGSATSIEGWKDLKVTWKTPIEKIESAAGLMGYGTPGISIPQVTVTGSLAWDSADTITAGDHQLVTDFRNNTSFSLCWTSAMKSGRIVSIFLPTLQHMKCPTPAASGADGMLYHTIEAQPGEYSGDTSYSTAMPANSKLRIGWA